MTLTMARALRDTPIIEPAPLAPKGRLEALLHRLEQETDSNRARISLMRIMRGDWEVRLHYPDGLDARGVAGAHPFPRKRLHPLEGAVGRGETPAQAVAELLDRLGAPIAGAA
jgi:hypothetical protein